MLSIVPDNSNYWILAIVFIPNNYEAKRFNLILSTLSGTDMCTKL
jgi:hypothetical protein